MLRFKDRVETKQIYANVRNVKGLSLLKLYRRARQEGDLDTGHHILLHMDGTTEYDRHIKAVAQTDFPEYETSIYVMVDAKDIKHISDAQKAVLSDLQREYNIPLKYTEV